MAIMGNRGKFTKKQIVDTLVLTHLSKCHDVTRVAKEQDLGTRSGCHSNVREIKTVFFKLFYLFTYYFTCFGGFVSFFRVLVHAPLPYRFRKQNKKKHHFRTKIYISHE